MVIERLCKQKKKERTITHHHYHNINPNKYMIYHTAVAVIKIYETRERRVNHPYRCRHS